MGRGKLKTSKTVAKRIKITAKGKVKRWKAGWNHYKTKKSAPRVRQLRKPVVEGPAQSKLIKNALLRAGK